MICVIIVKFQSLVALFTRAWIEIAMLLQITGAMVVALFTRAWIEIRENEPFAL